MCGICGQYSFGGDGIDEVRLRRATALLTHRGPDDEGFHVQAPIGLGVRRLSIIDVAGGHQPIFNEDQSKVIIFNGEIYNYLELRGELEAKGHRFRTRSDTEVILHLYEELGGDCVKPLNGQFAFAIWDGQEQKLLLARDRIGIKPLFYVNDGKNLYFASEIESLLQLSDASRQIDLVALNDYFAHFFVPGPRTVFKAVKKLPPAHILECQRGRVEERQYWRLSYDSPEKPRSLSSYAEELVELLKDSIRLRLQSEVPVGVLLSGGVDSGTLVALLREITSAPISTFTLKFPEPSYDESVEARATARRYGTDHHEFPIGPESVYELPNLIRYFGEPYGPFTAVQAYFLCKYARGHITVALGGEGGDELFAGYQTYVADKLLPYYQKLPAIVTGKWLPALANGWPTSYGRISLDFMAKEFVRGAQLDLEKAHCAWKLIFDRQERARLYRPEVVEQLEQADPHRIFIREYRKFRGKDRLEKFLFADLKAFAPDSMLVQSDRVSMANSLELRVPYFDHRLVEFAARVPMLLKLRGLTTKYLLRKAMEPYLPHDAIWKRKRGFTAPLPTWLQSHLRQFACSILSRQRVKRTGILNFPHVQKLLLEHFNGIRDHHRRVWSLMVFVLWHERYQQ